MRRPRLVRHQVRGRPRECCGCRSEDARGRLFYEMKSVRQRGLRKAVVRSLPKRLDTDIGAAEGRAKVRRINRNANMSASAHTRLRDDRHRRSTPSGPG